MVRLLFPRLAQDQHRSWVTHGGQILLISLLFIQIRDAYSVVSAGGEAERQAQAAGQGREDWQVRRLEPGIPIERDLVGDQSHVYRLALVVDQYAKLVVDQRGIDVVVRVLAPDGKQIAEFDSENRVEGQELVSLVAPATVDYQVIVRPKRKSAAAGAYRIRIAEVRAATGDDRALDEARQLYEKHLELYRADKYDEALTLINRALEIRVKILGPEHGEVGAALHSLAILYRVMGEQMKAKQFFERAIAIKEKALGSEHPELARSINYLGIVHKEEHDYAEAERLYQRALAILEKALGPEHSDVAMPLNNLALLYSETGESAKAEPLYQRALAIFEKALGPEHPVVALALNNLATVYDERGDYAKAEPLLQRALAIREKVLGPEHHDVGSSLYNLANLNCYKEDYAKAEPLYRRALAIFEKALGPEHPDVAMTINNLAEVSRYRGNYRKAEPLYQRALAISEKALGPEHPIVAVSLNDLANLYWDMGSYAKAERLARRALAIREKVLGPDHPSVADTLGSLAHIYQAKGDLAQAIAFQSRANTISEHNLERNLIGSERQKLAYLALFSKETDFTLSLHSQAAPHDPQALNLALTTLLRRKGRVLDAMTDMIAALRRHATPENQILLNQLAAARSQLAAFTLKESVAAKSAAYRRQLKPLEEKVEELEEKLSSRSAEFRAQAQPITIDAVRAALPANSALVEFAVYLPRESRAEKSNPPHYVAYLLPSQGQPKWVDLGATMIIDRAVESWRKALSDPNRSDVKQLARAVESKVMQPVRSLLGETRRVLIAPDGLLNLIPFAALVDEQGQYLIERYSISYLTSGRDLLRLQTSQPNKNAPLVMANPAFGKAATIARRGGESSRNSPAGNNEALQVDLTQVFFQPLPDSEDEAVAIKAVLPEAVMLLRENATEAALKQAKAPSILHIATHGFFLSDQKAARAEARGAGNRGSLRGSDLRLSKWAAYIEDPLMRSGLALAGANQGQSGDDDGVLTALEAAGLDLWGTKLAVLSACNTGVGEVKNGEGVQGVRRALVLAGSESQVITLWPVLGDATKDLMIPYYQALRQGAGRSEGLRQVQLQALRSEHRQHPFYWAAFIQSGAWTQLDDQE